MSKPIGGTVLTLCYQHSAQGHLPFETARCCYIFRTQLWDLCLSPRAVNAISRALTPKTLGAEERLQRFTVADIAMVLFHSSFTTDRGEPFWLQHQRLRFVSIESG